MVHSAEAMLKTHNDSAQIYRDSVAHVANRHSNYWDIVDELAPKLDVRGVKVFFEGYSGKRRVKKLDSFWYRSPLRGTPEYRTLNGLLKKGAILETTEDANLLRDELLLTQKLASAYEWKDKVERAKLQTVGSLQVIKGYEDRIRQLGKELQDLHHRRNEVVAKRIVDGLQDGETGLLFFGGSAEHDIISMLPPDVSVELLDERLGEIIEEVKRETRSEGADGSPEGKG